MKGTIRIAVLGAGRVAQHYKKMLDSGVVSGYKLVGVCDINASAAKILGDHWGCSSFTNYETMIANVQPDLILLLTPSGLHYEHAVIALNSGCNVLVEKPVTMLPDDAYDLIRIAKEKKLMLGVAFQNRLNPAIQCLQTAVTDKRFGSIVTATIRLRWCRYQNYYEDGWHGTWSQDGGVINQQAIHHVDALNWLMGPVESVCATISNRLNSLEAEDTMVAIIRFESGALGTIEATTAARPQDYEASLSVVGEKGLAVIGGIALNKVETWAFTEPQPDDVDVPSRYSLEVPNGYGLSHGPLLQSVIQKLLKEDITAPVPVEQSVGTTELIHALYRSHEIGGWVTLKDKPLSIKLGKKG